MTDTEKAICTALNTYCFLNIWNEPLSEYRVNIQPILMDKKSRSGAVSINGVLLELPRDDEPFFLYSISTDCFRHALDIDSDTWYDSVTLCNDRDILVHVFTHEGKMCSHMDCYLMMLPMQNAYVLAVSKRTFMKLGVSPTDVNDIYVTIYKDSDIANKTTLYSYKIPTNDRNGTYRLEIIKKLQEIGSLDQVILYVNGYEVEFSDPALLEYDDYVDIIHDTNIILSFEVECPDNQNRDYWMYYSEKYQDNRIIIHMPKALNPEKKVLTHNTCDFFIRRKIREKFPQEGLYVQRTADRSISQITHQDFSLPETVLDAYRDYLGISKTIPDSQAVTVYVRVRQHDKDNILVRDKNYIDMLYTQDDATIIQCLKEYSRPKKAPEFWMAKSLEASTYVNMMFDIPDTIRPENMYTYVEGLGYYHTIGLLCSRVFRSTVTDIYGGFMSFNKPYLYHDRKIYPIIYHNGKKIHRSQVVVTQSTDDIQYNVSFINTNFAIGDDIIVETFIDGNRQSHAFKVSADSRTVTVPYTEYVLYQEIDDSPSTAYGIDYTTHMSYKKITTTTGICTVTTDTLNGTTTFTFSANYIGTTFHIQNKYCVRPLSLESDLRNKIASGDPLAFNLTWQTTDGDTVPIFEVNSVQVFLNGRYLINGLDYHIATVKGLDGRMTMHQLVIQNKSYLLGNYADTLEVIVTSAEIEDTSFGFVKNDMIIHASNRILALWFEGISTAHIEGYIELDLVNQSTHMEVPDSKYRQGAPYEIATRIPRLVKDFVDTYHGNDDRERMIAINEYFYGSKTDLSGIIVLPYSHQLYSIYMAAIIRDVVNGDLILALDPDNPRMKRQVKDYEYLKSYDLVFKDDTETIDLTYTDVFPTYSEWGGVPVETVQLVHALTKLLMPLDDFSSGEVPDVHE